MATTAAVEAAAGPKKIRHGVRALDQSAPWCIPLPATATIADLARATEILENGRLQRLQGEDAQVCVDIQIDFGGELCEVSPDDLLTDHLAKESEEAIIFVAVRRGGGSSASSLISHEAAPSLVAPAAPAAAPALVRAAQGPESFRRQPYVSPSSTPAASLEISVVSSSDAATTEQPKSSNVGAAGENDLTGRGPSGDCSSHSCDACHTVFAIATPTFCCRICRKLFHSECAGYNTSTKRQSPPPDWICPRCPNGERGPSEAISRCLKGKGAVKQQRGNQPWCPICLGDNRVPGTGKMGKASTTKCRGCGLHTHALCLPKLEVGPDGRWPCDECQRRRDGVVPGNNPVWLRLKEARLDGGWEVSVVPDPAAAAAKAAAASAVVEGAEAAAATPLYPAPAEDLGHHQPSSDSAQRCTKPAANSRRRRSSLARRASDDTTTSCCNAPVTPKRPAFCCRVCRKLFHGACVGYSLKKRQVPPPDWICPHCPNGERGPSGRVHRSLKGKGIVNQKLGNMPWCPICLSDDRISGKTEIGDIEKCLGCGFHTHAHCLAGLQVYPDGTWPCDECQRRRDGVVPGDNPVWQRLKAARLDGGLQPTWTHVPPSPGATGTAPPAAAPADSPSSDVTDSLECTASSSPTAQEDVESVAGACEPAEGRPPPFHQDHVQRQHEKAASGSVGCLLLPSAAGAATERAALHCPPAGPTVSDRLQLSDGWAPSRAVALAVRAAADVVEAASAEETASRDPPVGLAPSSAEVLAARRAALPPPAAADPCSQSSVSPNFGRGFFLGSLAVPSADPEPAALAATPAAGATTLTGVHESPIGAGASCPLPAGSVLSSMGAFETREAAPPGVPESRRPNFQEVFLASGLALSSADAAAMPSSAFEAVAPEEPAASPTSTIDHLHHREPRSCTALGGQETAAVTEAAAEEARAGEAEGGKTDPAQTISSPPPANPSSKGASSGESDITAHTPAVAPSSSIGGRKSCCEACDKVFIPKLRPSFCCRTCRKLFHGDCAGYARHKRQCPPPDWICPRCPNGERGPTEYDIHTSLRGEGSVKQTLGNQSWCPICLGDDRVPGSAKSDPGGKKCLGCGLRAHSHCMSGLEVESDGRWPCDECQRRRDGITGDSPLWQRLKAARLDGGPSVATTGVPHSPSGATITASAAASTGSPALTGVPSSGSGTWGADAGPAAAAGAACPSVTHSSSSLSVVSLHGGLKVPSSSLLRSEGKMSTPGTTKASATSAHSSQDFFSDGSPEPSSYSAAPATSSTCSLSSPSTFHQPAQPPALPALPSASHRLAVPTVLPGSSPSPASSSSEAPRGSARASPNVDATPSRVVTTENRDMVGNVNVLIPGDVSSDDAAGGPSPPRPIFGPAAAQGAPIASSSLATTAIPLSPVPPALSAAQDADSVPDANAEAPKDEDQVARLDGSKRDRTVATGSQPASKKPRLADSSTGQLPSRAAIRSKCKAAETIAVAAAQLLGGIPDQQREAEAFVEKELANHNMDLCSRLIVGLKRTVDVNEGGVWVNRTAVADLCGTSKAPTDFPCVVRYIVGAGCRKSGKASGQEARQCFSQVVMRARGGGGAFEAYNVGGETMLRWKGGTSA